MTNKKKLDSRSNKRKIKLPNKYNDHVMSSLSQNRANPEPPMNCDEIRVNIGGNQVDCDELEVNKLGDEINKIRDLSERYEEVSDDESDKLADIGSENLVRSCLPFWFIEEFPYGFKEIVDNGNGNWLFKFTKTNGMMEVVNKSPWMEAWTNDGISAIDSSIGKPKIMDNMTSYVCKNGVGRTEFARVLMEIKAKKGFKNEIVIQYIYKDKNYVVPTGRVVVPTFNAEENAEKRI
ncbi:hypothetical protein Tco_1140000 [Tanacetum coccineum]